MFQLIKNVSAKCFFQQTSTQNRAQQLPTAQSEFPPENGNFATQCKFHSLLTAIFSVSIFRKFEKHFIRSIDYNTEYLEGLTNKDLSFLENRHSFSSLKKL